MGHLVLDLAGDTCNVLIEPGELKKIDLNTNVGERLPKLKLMSMNMLISNFQQVVKLVVIIHLKTQCQLSPNLHGPYLLLSTSVTLKAKM